MKKIIFFFSYLLSLVLTPRVINFFNNFVAKIIWHGYKNKFRLLGCGAFIRFPESILNPQYISLGNNFSAQRGFILEAFDNYNGQIFCPEIVIGNNSTFGQHCHIGCINKVSIGINLLAASKILITDHSHGLNGVEDISAPPVRRQLISKGPIRIGNNVWIGEGVVILSGVSIGDGCIIGANSVVDKDIPSYSIAAGVPARILKQIR